MRPAKPEPLLVYPAILTTEAGRTLVSFPDCPTCRTFAEPGEDVLPIAQHALTGRLAAAIQDETEPPHPTSLSRFPSTQRILPVTVPTDLALQLEAKWRVSAAVAAANEGVGSWKRPFVLLWRGLTLRCPNCAGGPLFKGWLQMQARCPVCRMRLERGEEGYQVGAYMFNIVAAELFFAAIFLAVLIYRWPSPPWTLLLYGGMVMMVVVPVLFYPFSKDVFLAFDLIFRPPGPEDFN
jgi:uncharacterized protein (DUF983 family)/predicted RNase H-like HicB family nuclease